MIFNKPGGGGERKLALIKFWTIFQKMENLVSILPRLLERHQHKNKLVNSHTPPGIKHSIKQPKS